MGSEGMWASSHVSDGVDGAIHGLLTMFALWERCNSFPLGSRARLALAACSSHTSRRWVWSIPPIFPFLPLTLVGMALDVSESTTGSLSPARRASTSCFELFGRDQCCMTCAAFLAPSATQDGNGALTRLLDATTISGTRWESNTMHPMRTAGHSMVVGCSASPREPRLLVPVLRPIATFFVCRLRLPRLAPESSDEGGNSLVPSFFSAGVSLSTWKTLTSTRLTAAMASADSPLPFRPPRPLSHLAAQDVADILRRMMGKDIKCTYQRLTRSSFSTGFDLEGESSGAWPGGWRLDVEDQLLFLSLFFVDVNCLLGKFR